MTVLTSLTLKQLAIRVVVREDLPTKDLPNSLKRELEALAMLPGDYTIIGKAKKLGKCGGGNLTREELIRVNGMFKKGKKKSALMGDVGQIIQVAVINTTTGTDHETEKEKQWSVRRNAGPRIENLFLLRNKMTDKVNETGIRVVEQVLVDEGRLTYKSCHKGITTSRMFINKEGMLVMSCSIQEKGYELSWETTAQRD